MEKKLMLLLEKYLDQLLNKLGAKLGLDREATQFIKDLLTQVITFNKRYR